MALAGAPASYDVVDGKVQNGQLELNVVEHCNLTCRSCSHLSPVLPKLRVEAAAVERDLTLLSRHYHVEWLKIVGGEPLLHPDLVSLAHAIRRSGVADRIYVVTNGVLLPRMAADLWAAVDWIEVSLYPGKSLSREQQGECWSQAHKAGTGLSFRQRNEFRTSYSELGTADVTLSRAIYRSCAIAHEWKCHTVADGRFFKCPQSYFLPKVLDGCADNAAPDSLLIEDSDEFAVQLQAYLNSPEPLQSCRNCLGSAGKAFPHTQIKRANFRGAQQRSTEDLLDASQLRHAGWQPTVVG